MISTLDTLAPPALACNASRLREPLGGQDAFSIAARVIPTLFVPGVPKAGTSFLWGCLVEAFRPARVCEAD